MLSGKPLWCRRHEWSRPRSGDGRIKAAAEVVTAGLVKGLAERKPNSRRDWAVTGTVTDKSGFWEGCSWYIHLLSVTCKVWGFIPLSQSS